MKAERSIWGVTTRSESEFISQTDYQNIFWNIFHTGTIAAAFSDIEGNIIFANAEFNARFVKSNHLPNILTCIGHNPVIKMLNAAVIEYTSEVGGKFIRLLRMDLPCRTNGATHFWFSDTAADGHHVSVVKKLYRSFIDNTFELIFRSGEDDKLIFTNKLFIRTFEFESFRDARGFALQDLFADPLDFNVFLQHLIQKKQINNETIRFRTLSGKCITGQVNCNLHYDDKGNRVLHWTVLDISERVLFEESLRQKNEQLAKLNLRMEKFLYSTSHDLRSPLTSVLGLVNLLKLESTDKNVLEYVSKIEGCTLKLDKIIRDIMSYSKNTYQRIKREPIDVDVLLRKTIDNYRGDPNFKLINFEVTVQADAPYFSDGERLAIMLDCLIRNCIHFVDMQKVRPMVKIHVIVNSEGAFIDIIDNGIGIGKQHLDQIFTMFYKASLQSRGAGLGLYIVKEGLEQLKGSIKVESEIGFGSIFKLQIPNEKAEQLSADQER